MRSAIYSTERARARTHGPILSMCMKKKKKKEKKDDGDDTVSVQQER